MLRRASGFCRGGLQLGGNAVADQVVADGGEDQDQEEPPEVFQ